MAINTEIKDQDKFQDLYTIFVSQGIKLANGMLKNIQQTPDSIASAILAIVARLEESGKKNGLNFDLPVIFHGSKEILIYIISQLGMEVDENFVKQTVGLMVGKYLQNAISSGKMTKEEAQQLAAQMQQSGQQQPQQKQGLISQQMGGMNNG